MSHELRTPMNAVIGMTGLLLDLELGPEPRELLETIRVSGDSLLWKINEILDFSKIESGAIELDFAPFDLQDCVDGALALVALIAENKGLELVSIMDAGCPEMVVGDAARFRQVIVSLLDNAVKFTTNGEILVTVSAEQISGYPGSAVSLTVAVSDTGIGIPGEQMDRVFEPFGQVDSSSTRAYGGSGLGLVISRRLAEAVGGDVRASSEVGVGSTFTFTAVMTSGSNRRLGGADQPGGSLTGQSALIVDDNATSRRALVLLLQGWGMSCTEAATPVAALKLFAAGHSVDLALWTWTCRAWTARNLPPRSAICRSVEKCRWCC